MIVPGGNGLGWPTPVGNRTNWGGVVFRSLVSAQFPSGDKATAKPSPRRTAGEPSVFLTYTVPFAPPPSPSSSKRIVFPSDEISWIKGKSNQDRSCSLVSPGGRQ